MNPKSGTVYVLCLETEEEFVDGVPLSVKILVGCKECVGCESDVGRRQPGVQFMVLKKLWSSVEHKIKR